MSLFNSIFLGKYIKEFVNNTVSFQINDARQLPIIIPTAETLKEFETIFKEALSIKKMQFAEEISPKDAEIQQKLDNAVNLFYGI